MVSFRYEGVPLLLSTPHCFLTFLVSGVVSFRYEGAPLLLSTPHCFLIFLVSGVVSFRYKGVPPLLLTLHCFLTFLSFWSVFLAIRRSCILAFDSTLLFPSWLLCFPLCTFYVLKGNQLQSNAAFGEGGCVMGRIKKGGGGDNCHIFCLKTDSAARLIVMYSPDPFFSSAPPPPLYVYIRTDAHHRTDWQERPFGASQLMAFRGLLLLPMLFTTQDEAWCRLYLALR